MYAPIPSRPNYYAGDDGSIWSVRPGRVLKRKPCWASKKRNRAYICFRPYDLKQVSHLVLEAFVGPRPEGLECCHNNGDSRDNRPENLRWDTRESNVQDKHTHGIYKNAKLYRNYGLARYFRKYESNAGESNGNVRMTADTVRQIMVMSGQGDSPKKIGKALNVPAKRVSAVVCGRIWASVTGLPQCPRSKGVRKKKTGDTDN